MPVHVYSFLNGIAYISMVIYIIFFVTFLNRVQAWLMIELSLLGLLLMTSIMLLVALRYNIDWGVSDEVATGVMFFFGTQPLSWTFGIITIYVELTYLVPENVEASIMALIDSTFIWSYEVGARLSAFAYCAIWKVDEYHIERYAYLLIAKLMIILVLMLVVPIMIPRNEKIQELAVKLRK